MTETTFKDALLVAASRAAKIVVGFGTTFALVRWKIDLPPVLQTVFEQILAAAFAGSVLGTAAHFGVALRANPSDTASPTESKVGRQKKRQRKIDRRTTKKAGLENRELEEPPPVPPLAKIPAKERGEL